MSALAWVRGEQLLALSTEGAEERENAAGRRQSPSTRRRGRGRGRQTRPRIASVLTVTDDISRDNYFVEKICVSIFFFYFSYL